MIELIKVECYKLSKHKLLATGAMLAVVPGLLNILSYTNKDMFTFSGGDQSMSLGLRLMMLVSFVLYTGMPSVYGAFLANTLIAQEINSERICYEILGKGKRKRVFFAKIMTVFLVLGFVYLIMLALGSLVIWLCQDKAVVNDFDGFYLMVLLNVGLFIVGQGLVTGSLAFMGLQNSNIALVFITNIILINLSKSESLARLLPGGLIYGGGVERFTTYRHLMLNQNLLLAMLCLLIMALAYNRFSHADY